MGGNHRGSCLNMVFVLNVSLLHTCIGYSSTPSVSGEATGSRSMCLNSPRNKRHWSPRDMVKWGHEKHNTWDGEALALQQQGHRRPLPITKHFTKLLQTRPCKHSLTRGTIWAFPLEAHCVLTSARAFLAFTGWGPQIITATWNGASHRILRLTKKIPTCYMVIWSTERYLRRCWIPNKSDLINVIETRVHLSYLFSEMQGQTLHVFAQKNIRNRPTVTDTHCIKKKGLSITPGTRSLMINGAQRGDVHRYFHDGHSSRPWRSLKCLRKFMKMESRMATHRISPVRPLRISMERTVPVRMNTE